MLISFGFDISLRLELETAVLFCLKIHPSRSKDLIFGENFRIEPQWPFDEYLDAYGNRCGRVRCGPGIIRFINGGIVRDSGELDPVFPQACQDEISRLPHEALVYLLPSRYCETDGELANLAWTKFGALQPGWARVQAICDFVHEHVAFDYMKARANRTAHETLREGVGVCRDFTHLAIALCRCVNLPARYVTGYLGDIGVPPAPYPMDFSAWMEVYLGGRWVTFDPRHNCQRIGRIVIARGRDASDVALTMVFGNHTLAGFSVVTEEVSEDLAFRTLSNSGTGSPYGKDDRGTVLKLQLARRLPEASLRLRAF
jgi:transglutaminase-like putative cysteine protease